MTIKIRQHSEGTFPIHESTESIPMASDTQQAALTLSIKEHGQQEPVVVCNGAIIDGRCRQKALASLGLDILYIELDTGSSTSDVDTWVGSVNTRRQLTTTQLAFTAARQYLDPIFKNTGSIEEVADSWAVSKSTVTQAIWLYNNKPDVAELLFNGRKINIVVDDKPRTTSSTTAIYKYYKKQIQ